MTKPERKAKAGAEICDITNDWYAFIILVRVEKKLLGISHACVENYMYALAGLDFVSCRKPTKRSQSGGCNHHH